MPVEVVAKAKYCTNNAITSESSVTIKDNSTIYIHKSDKIDNELIENHMIEMFKFHTILPIEANPNQTYGQILLDKIDKTKYGQNTVFLCYGQYKSGKTHNLLGKNDQKSDRKTMGLLPRAVEHILNISTQLTNNDRFYSVSLRVLRIFNDKLHDVLNNDSDIRIIDRKNLKGRITWAQNATIIPIKSIEDFNSVITKINNNISLPPHNHIVYTLYLQHSINSDKNIKSKQYIHSQIHFVELASSDKLAYFIQKKSHPLYPLSPNGKAMNIHHQTNKFLHKTLESLVTAFTFMKQNAKFIPLRNSKLTHILKDCLNDNKSNIILFLTIIPLQKYLNETLKTLHFGEQIYYQCHPIKPKQISKSTKINIESSNHLPYDYDAKEYQQAPSNIIQLLYEMKQLISSPSTIKPKDIENMHHRISDMTIYLRHNNHDMMHCKNMVHRLENENKMLREHINKQNKVIIDFKKAIQVEKQSHIKKKSTSPKISVDSKIDDIEYRLKEHTSMLQSLQDECIQNMHDTNTSYTADDESSILPLSEIMDDIQKTKSNELEKVFAARHNFETLNI
eukprot:266808_1